MGRFRALHDLTRRDDSVDNRRRGGRILIDQIRCSAGKVLDLSSTGARLSTAQNWDKDDANAIEFIGPDGRKLCVMARCMWVKRRWFSRRRVVGVRFEGLTDVQQLQLTKIATGCAKRAWGPPRSKDNVDWKKLERQAKWKGSSKKDAA